MTLIRLNLAKIRRLPHLAILAAGVVLVGTIAYGFQAAAATSGFEFVAGTDTYKVGETVSVGIYENSGNDCANVARASFTYPANLLKYEGSIADGSKFEGVVPTKSGDGVVTVRQYTSRKECGSGGAKTSGVSGRQLVATASFTVTATGTASLDFKTSSLAVSSADNKTNVSVGSTNQNLSLIAADTLPASGQKPDPAGNTKSNDSNVPNTESIAEPSYVTAMTPDGTDTAIALANTDTIQLDTPVNVQPLPILPDGVNRIEYYLNGKLQATVKTAPYTYHLDPSKLLNGKYSLTTKTYYLNGQIKSVSQITIIHNKFGLTQLRLRLLHLAWLFILLFIALAAALAAWVRHRRGGSGRDSGVGDYSVDKQSAPSDNSVITPTTSNLDQSIASPTTSELPASQSLQAAGYSYDPNRSDWQPRTAALGPDPTSPLPTPSAPISPGQPESTAQNYSGPLQN